MYQKQQATEQRFRSKGEIAKFRANSAAIEEANKDPAFRKAAKEFIKYHTGKSVKV